MPFIQNTSMDSIRRGNHKHRKDNTMLIQLVDPGHAFPEPAESFKEIHQFSFLDLEGSEGMDPELEISSDQAQQLVDLLNHALDQDMDVIVHCHAGICRSGAVAEVGVIMGFDDVKTHRQPNLLVKHKMLKCLGMYSY